MEMQTALFGFTASPSSFIQGSSLFPHPQEGLGRPPAGLCARRVSTPSAPTSPGFGTHPKRGNSTSRGDDPRAGRVGFCGPRVQGKIERVGPGRACVQRRTSSRRAAWLVGGKLSRHFRHRTSGRWQPPSRHHHLLPSSGISTTRRELVRGAPPRRGRPSDDAGRQRPGCPAVQRSGDGPLAAEGSDHKEHVNRFYRAFLKETYGTLDALNVAHGTSHGSFDDVDQPRARGPWPSARGCTWIGPFYRRYYATYFATLSRRAKERGWTCPLLQHPAILRLRHSRARQLGAHDHVHVPGFSAVTPNLVFGGAYQMRHLDFENFHDVALTTEVTRMITAVDVPAAPAVVDPARGTLAEGPAFTPWRSPRCRWSAPNCKPASCGPAAPVSHAGGIERQKFRRAGLAGVNGYMLAGGENPPGWAPSALTTIGRRPSGPAVKSASTWTRFGGSAASSNGRARIWP